jgi:hypothetical protein
MTTKEIINDLNELNELLIKHTQEVRSFSTRLQERLKEECEKEFERLEKLRDDRPENPQEFNDPYEYYELSSKDFY